MVARNSPGDLQQAVQRAEQSAAPTDCHQEGEPDRRWSRPFASRLALAAILLLAFAVYAPTLDDWFSGDDFWFLRSSQATSVGEYALEALDFRQTGTLPEFDRYRPLYPIAWRLMYPVFGLNALGYHAVLVALHLGCTVLVWLIARRLTKLAWAASLAALIFAIHPAYTDAVAWLSGGNRVFVTFPYLLSLLLFMKYLDGGNRRGALYLGSFLAFVAAILLHSAALTLAAVLPAYVFLVAGKPAEALRPRSWVQFVPFAIVSVALLSIQVWVRTNLDVEDEFRFGAHQYTVYGQYFGVALLPTFRLEPSGFAEPLARLLDGLELVASVAMILITVGLLRDRRWPYLGIFVAWWFYLSLLPDSTLLFRAQGRVLYLPGASLAIFFVLAILLLIETLPASLLRLGSRVAPLLVLAVLVPTAALTFHYGRGPGENATANEAFIAQLQNSVSSMDSDSVLHVIGAPLNVTVFDDTRLDALVELYYGELEVHSLRLAQAAQVEATLGEGDRIFQYQP